MNVPKLRFKEFKNDWSPKNLSEVVAFSKGNSLSKSDLDEQGSYPCILYGELYTKYHEVIRKVFSKTNYISDNIVKSKYGDILIPASGETPIDISTSSCILLDNVLLGGDINILSPKNCDGRFISYMISNNKRKTIARVAQGHSIVHLYSENLKKVNLDIPLLSEQKKIADMLELLDKKIELQTKKIEALKLFKLSITQNIFNEKKLNDFQSVTLGKILKPGSKIPVKNTSEYEKMTVKLNFKGLAKLETKKEMADTRPFYVRNENEIIIGKQNYFNGSIAKVTKDFKGCICSNAIMSFTTINGVNVDYVLYYLSQKNYINRRKFLANGTGQKELSEKEFLKFVIKLPSTQIQNNISKKISCVSNLLLLENKKLTTLKNLKKGLLQNMFI